MSVKSIRRLDGQGRVIVPSHIRRALNLSKDSEITISMTSNGGILIRPAEERCSICGEGIEGKPHVTIESKNICWDCSNRIWGEWQDHYHEFFPSEEE